MIQLIYLLKSTNFYE